MLKLIARLILRNEMRDLRIEKARWASRYTIACDAILLRDKQIAAILRHCASIKEGRKVAPKLP